MIQRWKRTPNILRIAHRLTPPDRVEIGNSDHCPDNGNKNNSTSRNAEQEVLERRRNPGPSCFSYIWNHHGCCKCTCCQSSDYLLLQRSP
ncbi:hypothetical protein OIU79_012278 [Salix purpurea]|uniref:Uncharacterized protein n=1 Tax=Salix purpurea TaxID=77065 RepID=A0A9Q0Q2R3_SALPP|nr:hypothetical protein OIU79_012278 [Salix purpurea]